MNILDYLLLKEGIYTTALENEVNPEEIYEGIMKKLFGDSNDQ